jgi:hypothetical protein
MKGGNLMNKRRWFGLLLLGVLLFASSIPAGAADPVPTAPLVINNRSGFFIPVSLKGPQDYSFDAPREWSTKRIQKGVYHYTYNACGDKRKGAFEVTPSGARLVIYPCRTVNVRIVNHTGDRLGLSLLGPMNYFYSLPVGATTIKVLPGIYQFTGYACAKTTSGSMKLTSGGRTWEWDCNE